MQEGEDGTTTMETTTASLHSANGERCTRWGVRAQEVEGRRPIDDPDARAHVHTEAQANGRTGERTREEMRRGEERATTHLEREQRAEVDDLAAAARHHVLPRGLGEEPDGLEVHVEDLCAVSTAACAAQRCGKGGRGGKKAESRKECGSGGGNWRRVARRWEDEEEDVWQRQRQRPRRRRKRRTEGTARCEVQSKEMRASRRLSGRQSKPHRLRIYDTN